MLKKQWVSGIQWKRYLMTALAATALLASAAWAADPITDANVDAAIASAKTPEDHAALAAYFTSKSHAAMADAERHDKMAKSFFGSKSMPQHCSNLASADRKQAREYGALAKEQDQLSKGTTGGGQHKK
jgi:hypothetical protein